MSVRTKKEYSCSIIIPCYNKAHCLKTAMGSILNLSRFEDFEIIVVDDHSTDNSLELLKEYDKQYENIKVIRLDEPSGSPSKPRNTGMEMASSPYFIFMDPDDKIINDGYSTLLTKMEEFKSDILIATRIGATPGGKRVFTDFIDERFKPVNENNDFIKKFLINKPPFILKTIYDRDFLKKNGIAFNEDMKTSEDEIFDMTCVAYADRITKIDDIVYQYTSGSENSITTRVDLKLYEELYDVMKGVSAAYNLSFDEDVVNEKIATLFREFYMGRVGHFNDVSSARAACELMRDAFAKYGFDNFSCLSDSKNIRFMQDMEQRNFEDYINEALIRRINTLDRRLKQTEKMLKKSRKDLKKANAKLNRKIVKPAVKLAESISNFKGKTSEGASTAKEKTIKADFFSDYHTYENQLKEFALCNDESSNEYWVFMDRHDNAKDNGEALYRYVKNNQIHDKLAFILDQNSIDYDRLVAEGFNVVPFDTIEHWKLLKNAEYFFSSHCDGFLRYPWYYTGPRDQQKKLKNTYKINPLYKMVFLQHGVIRSNLADWLGVMPFYKFVASAYPEKKSLLAIPKYNLSEEQIAFSGLPRWDYLKRDVAEGYITIFPTWRKDIFFGTEEELEDRFSESAFANNWRTLLKLISETEIISNYKVRLILHHDNEILQPYIKRMLPEKMFMVPFSEVDSWTEIINSSHMLITDYSSLSFDFLYLDKPVIYFDFEGNAQLNNVAGMEYDRYGYYTQNSNKALQMLNKIIEDDFIFDSEKLNNINNLFVNRDGMHCKLLIDML